MHDTIVGLVGLPRSGTTLIHRAIAAHSQVDGIIEPYQTGRHEAYSVTSLSQLLKDSKITPKDGRGLLVKETTTRAVNVELLFQLLASARASKMYTGLIIILRCPFEAYLSQVEASNKFWKEKKLTESSGLSFTAFANSTRRSLRVLVHHARCQHFRIVSYEQFCQASLVELARLMALFPYPLESVQLSMPIGSPQERGGDPKTYEKGNQIIMSDRSERVSEVMASFQAEANMTFFKELRRICKEEACRLPDGVVLEHITDVVLRR